MGARRNSAASTTIANAALVTTAETVVATSPGISPPLDGGSIKISAYLNVTTGAGATAVTARIRRGSGTTGAVINVASPIAIAASSASQIVIIYVDINPGTIAAEPYSLTLQQTAATGNATVNDVAMVVEEL